MNGKTADQPQENKAWKEAEAAGFDMRLLEANLRKSPLERIQAHDRALSMAVELRKAVQLQTETHAPS